MSSHLKKSEISVRISPSQNLPTVPNTSKNTTPGAPRKVPRGRSRSQSNLPFFPTAPGTPQKVPRGRSPSPYLLHYLSPASRDPFDAGIRPTEHPLGSEPIFPTLLIDPPGRSTRLRLYSSNPIKTEWVHLIPSIYLALLIISPFLTRSSISPHSFSPCSHFIYPAFQASL